MCMHVVWLLVNVAVSEMSILRMRTYGQLAININPIYTSPYIFRPLPALSVRPIRSSVTRDGFYGRHVHQISLPVSEQSISLCAAQSLGTLGRSMTRYSGVSYLYYTLLLTTIYCIK